MNLKGVILLFFLLFSTFLAALDISLTHASFQSNESYYLQIFTRVNASTIKMMPIGDDQFKGSVAALILIKLDNEIIIADKYVLNSPTQTEIKDFWDSKIYQLKPGSYKLEYTFSDVANEESTINEQRNLEILSYLDKPQVSDLLLLSSVSNDNADLPFEKSGFYYEPLAYDILPDNPELLTFNWELYDLDKSDQDVYISFYVYEGYKGQPGKQILKKHKKVENESFISLVESFPIMNLGTGEYHLTCELYNYDQKMISFAEKNFSVIQPISDIRKKLTYDKEFDLSFVQILTVEELNYGIRAIQSQVSNNLMSTLNNVVRGDDIEIKKYFLYSFWSKINPDNPGLIYESFMEVARAVDEEYGNNVGYGFETDKGYIFMKYGRPNDMIDVTDEVNAPPYSIWIYNDFPATNQSNVKFLFYSPSLSGNDFILLHSTCNQELSNPRWEQVLYADAYGQEDGNSFDDNGMIDNFSRNARRYFQDN